MRAGPVRGSGVAVALITGALLAGALLVVAATPAAGDDRPKSHIKIKKLRATGAKGKIESKAKRCLRDRKVTLFYYEDFVTRKAAITESKRDGRWKVRKSLAPGRYFAKVDRGQGCRYDVSSTSRL
ncbi:MAG: hypothetical protein GEU88_09895 [Solirubrobacterales bacterium]|nr:hypothetical protein [Solirubrobacterales bacterium]